MSLHRNPEFVRNVWLELSLQRLIATPLILGLLALIGWRIDPELEHLSPIALSLFSLLTIVWGSRLAAQSLTEELTQGTWDGQRLSGLSAGSMTLGKLAGGPVFAWYMGAFCLAVHFAAAGLSWGSLRWALIVVSGAVSMHALSLLITQAIARRRSTQAASPRYNGGSIVILLVIFLGQAPQLLMSAAHADSVAWYGLEFASLDFTLLSLALLAFWCVLGLYRSMRQELAHRDAPSAWAAFLLFVFVYSGGYFYGSHFKFVTLLDLPRPVLHLGFCGLFALAASYLMLFVERKDWLRLRRLVAAWRQRDLPLAWRLTPKWLVSAGCATLYALLFVIAAFVTSPLTVGISAAASAVALLAMLARDAALVLSLNFTRDQRRADAAAAIYLVVLYGLLPALLIAAQLHVLLPVFWAPMVWMQPPWLVATLMQAAFALEFARRRWNQLPA